MKKSVYILIGALCVSMVMLFSCQKSLDPAGTDSMQSLQDIKVSATYTKPPLNEGTQMQSETVSEADTTTKDGDTSEKLSADEESNLPVPETPPAENALETDASSETKTTESSTPKASDTDRETTATSDTETAVPDEIKSPDVDSEKTPETEKKAEETSETKQDVSETAAPEQPSSAPEPAEEQYLDFEKLKKVNPDIYAWIEIEGTVIDDPILQSPTDDSKYLRTAYDGSEATYGAIYTEATYNSTDFNDPVTLIYGHRTIAGNMFGALRPTYSDPTSFAEHSDIKIYLPGEVRHYTVFAAVPYENIHIMYTYDFSNRYWYKNFFKNAMKIRAIGANFNSDIVPEPDDHVIILSTCMEGEKTMRYLVMAVLSDDIN